MKIGAFGPEIPVLDYSGRTDLPHTASPPPAGYHAGGNALPVQGCAAEKIRTAKSKKTVGSLEKSKVLTVFSKVLSVFTKVLTVFLPNFRPHFYRSAADSTRGRHTEKRQGLREKR